MKYSFANLLIQSPKTSLTLGVEQIMLAFINEKNHEQQAYYINKVKNNQYFDLKIYDSLSMKKSDVIDLQNAFLYDGIEDINLKFYLIKNIDLASKYVLNALLKFIEEPPKNTIAIFSTKNLNQVLKTIKSRCQLFYLPANYDLYHQLIKQINQPISATECDLIFDDLDELKTLLENNEINEVLAYHAKLNDIKSFETLNDLKETFKNLSILQIHYLLKLIFIKINNINSKQAILDLMRANLKININKNSLFTIIYTIIIENRGD
ncbi:DNA polymerase III subunit delta [Ureaplasma urealyticum]|uniref:DNA polymerase III subunit delta n=2 Tax=Ureaplasma urealyticum TaxID=2130 RepID=A0AAX1R261_UREUR|nr:DNA polymerase III subunit delta [Ureaplasma urealyticum]ACI60159.1 DNA polymerase III delta subunit [Ureaplasma urealyticum serovar 10 str. ATCC 33699]EDT49796.1 DNA polymerase III delta subunit [Ureaplasma urealyticum serovar 13 str. ATCC 33698]EDX53370.1 DNA polymerase III delta subunit [Ureaplasma urealyticum serovar 12 str. ATCC 33696]EEH02477.1 DNA polymerase III delta subunit [Ureaplasma urealyticum serovar 2 str. ATCC 27814]MDU3864665.1 DNA polymerase III subunit delta [Ureaplasma u